MKTNRTITTRFYSFSCLLARKTGSTQTTLREAHNKSQGHYRDDLLPARRPPRFPICVYHSHLWRIGIHSFGLTV
jgi:hypothetical protein